MVKESGNRILYAVLFVMCTGLQFIGGAAAQQTDSWEQVQKNKRGTVTALWYDIDPFIFTDENGKLQGVEYELMSAFVDYVNRKYGYEISLNWEDAGSFENIYSRISQTNAGGIFGWSFFSITPERQLEVNFTPPYMPDINVLVTSDALPLYSLPSTFIDTLPYLQGYTMRLTSMEADVRRLVHNHPEVPVSGDYDDYEILRRISAADNAFGYVPLTVYVIALQKGIKVKRQYLFAIERLGLAGIFPKNSDWSPIVHEYFATAECKALVTELLSKYLGREIGEIILEGSGMGPEGQRSAELELLTKEREIVSQRLVNTMLEAEHDRLLRNISILVVAIGIIITALIYNRYRTKMRLSKLLMQRNKLIRKQNQDIERINRKLQMRVLQAQLNPHFVFNSLNDLQYFINQGDTVTSLTYVSRFSRFMRELLTQANEAEIMVSQEEKFLKLYLELERLRFEGRFDYTIEVAEDVPDDGYGLPPLVIYRYVENALYHGILNRETEGMIRVLFHYDKPHLVCSISDNGIGRKKAKEMRRKRDVNDTTPYSHLLHERIDIINEEVPGKIQVKVEDLYHPDGSAEGTRINIHFLIRSRADNNVLDY